MADRDCQRLSLDPPRSTARCETHGIPWRRKATAHDPSGAYHGAIQFDNPTWREAQGYMKPDRRTRRHAHKASLHHQLVVGIELAQRVGTGRWPVCR